MGTVISQAHLDRIHNTVKQTSGQVLAGGVRMTGLSPLDRFDLSKGSFYPPTVITGVNLKDQLWTEEVFGPVVVCQKFRVSYSPRLHKSSLLTTLMFSLTASAYN